MSIQFAFSYKLGIADSAAFLDCRHVPVHVQRGLQWFLILRMRNQLILFFISIIFFCADFCSSLQVMADNKKAVAIYRRICIDSENDEWHTVALSSERYS